MRVVPSVYILSRMMMLSRCSLIWRTVSRCTTLSVSCLVMVRVISFEVVQLARMIASKAVRMYRIMII